MDAAASATLSVALIDLDGTLMHTAPDLAAAANRVRGEFGLAALPVDRVAQFIGKGTEILMHRVLTDDLKGRVDEASFTRARASFERHYRAINGTHSRVFDGVPDAVALLRGAGLRVGCVTNKPREFALELIRRAGLQAQLDVVVGGDEVARRKPHPDVILEACRRLGLPVAQAVLMGDSANDVEAAQAAGCGSVLVETGYNEGEPVAALANSAGVGGIFPGLLEAARWVLERRPRAPGAAPGAPRQAASP